MVAQQARPADRILNDIIQKKGRGAATRRKLAANKERNWLLALTLHSFAKLADNAQLSDLERSIVTSFQKGGFSDEEIREHGRLSRSISRQLRDEIFTPTFAQLNSERSYSLKDLDRDADGIVKAILAKPNVTQIDVRAVHDGRAALKDFPRVPRSVLRETGSEMLVALEEDSAGVGAKLTSEFTIKAMQFRCIERATDSVFDPLNEVYWIFGSLGGGSSVTTRSDIFEEVDTGSSRTFNSGDGCIWGQNCAAQALPDGEIGSLVQLWEHDEGDTTKIKATVAAAFAAAGTVLAASGVAAWVSAVIAGVGVAVSWLIGLLDDEHIADQTFVFTRQVVENNTAKVGDHFDVTRRFTDGDGDYTLTIRVTRVT